MLNPSVVHISHLTKIYRKSHLGKVQATLGVEDLSLDIFQGEIFGLIGLNGAGKTTALKLILGLLFPTSGEISLLDKKMPDQNAIRQTGYLPEVPYFPKHLTATEILNFYGTLSDIPENVLRERAEKILDTVKMTPHKHKRVRECSKGMLQRISLAQALIHDPALLILDEPITGLDPLGLTEMREMILDLNSKGKTILFSSHIIAEVEKIAHRVGILVDGKLVRTLHFGEWTQQPGLLEKMFVDTVRQHGKSTIA